MASVGPKYPTAAADDGGGQISWHNPTNIEASDSSYASASGGGHSPYNSNVLRGSGYDFSVIGDSDLVTAITIEAGVKESSFLSPPKFLNWKITDSGNTKAQTATDSTTLTTSLVNYSHTFSGLSWVGSDVNTSSFKASIAFAIGNNSSEVDVDYIRVTITYTPASSVAAPPVGAFIA